MKYYLCFLDRAILNLKLIATNPNTENRIVHLFNKENFETLNKHKLTVILIKAHITFVVGDDNPLPGGLAKGVGNWFPEIP
jgi:hypothetical protein